MSWILADLAKTVNGQVKGDDQVVITGVASLHNAGPQDISFLTNPRYRSQLSKTRAGAVICPVGTEIPDGLNIIVCNDPHVAMAQLLTKIKTHLEASPESPSIHETAVIGKDCILGTEINIGPGAIIGDGVCIGDRTSIGAGTVMGPGTTVGEDCVIHANVTLYANVLTGSRVIIHSGAVIGSDGFGFAWSGKAYEKIPHLGTVQIADDVEIGANTAIDRAMLDETVIGQGTKIDNLVHVAHNVHIGCHSGLVAQVGIAGSTHIGDRTIIYAQSGITGHIRIGDNVIVGPRSGVADDLPDKSDVLGTPAINSKDELRILLSLRHLPDLVKKMRKLFRKTSDKPGDNSK